MHSGPDIVAVMVGVAVEGPYSYRVPEGMAVERGSIVAVPLGPRLILGVVWGPPQDMIAHNRLRDIAHVYAVPPLSGELLQLVEWVARYTLAAPGQVLRGVLRAPEALDAPRPVTAFRRTGYEPEKLTPARLRVLDTLADDAAWTRPALLGRRGCRPRWSRGWSGPGRWNGSTCRPRRWCCRPIRRPIRRGSIPSSRRRSTRFSALGRVNSAWRCSTG